MRLGLGDFAGDENIRPRRDGRLEIPLRAARAPRHAAHRAQRSGITTHIAGRRQRHRAAERLGHMVSHGLDIFKGSGRRKAQVLLAKPRIGGKPQHPAQLRVVAQFGMGIERQVVRKQVDVVCQQQLQPLLHPARDAAVLPAPEQAVVHKDGVGLRCNGRLDQRTAGGHAAHHAPDLGLALDLQAVGAVVLEALGLQQAVKRLQKLTAVNAHAAIVARHPHPTLRDNPALEQDTGPRIRICGAHLHRPPCTTTGKHLS